MPEPREPKLTKRQRAAQESAKAKETTQPQLQKGRRGTLTRRQLFGLGLGTAAAAIATITLAPAIHQEVQRQILVGSLEQGRKTANRTYEGPNPSLIGSKYLDSGTLAEYIRALNGTEHPFLQKIARDTLALSNPEPHPELTDLALASTPSPLPILERNSNTSTVSAFFTYDKESAPGKLTTANGESLVIPYITGVEFSITIGRQPVFTEASYRAQSLFLAKEVLSLGLELGYERYFGRLVEESGIGYFTDQAGNPVDDLAKHRLGGSLMHQQLSNPANDTWMLIDGLPILLLSHVGIEISGKKPFGNKDDLILGAFSNTSRILNNDRVLANEVDEFIRLWTASNSLAPGYGLVKKSSNGKLMTATRGL